MHEIYTVWNLLFHGYFLLSKLLAHKTLLLQFPVWLTTLCFVFCFFSHNSNCFWNHQTLIVLIKQFKNHFSLRVDWQKKCLQFYKTNFRPDKMIKLVSKFLFKILNFKQHISTNNLSNFYSAWRKLLILLLMHNCNTFWTFKHLQNTFFFIAFQQHKATLQSTNI